MSLTISVHTRSTMRILSLLCLFVGATHASTTMEWLAGHRDFTMLAGFMTKAGLEDILNIGTFTIFAPQNSAFNRLPASTLSTLRHNVTYLAEVLKYHMTSGRVIKSDVSNGFKVGTLGGMSARINNYTHNNVLKYHMTSGRVMKSHVSNGFNIGTLGGMSARINNYTKYNVVTIQGSQILSFDHVTSNGVIHSLHDIMLPPAGDIVDEMAKHSDLSSLLSYIHRAGIENTLRADHLTMFAPTNAAFSKLTSHVTQALHGGLLNDILLYSLVNSTEFSKGLYPGKRLRSLFDSGAELVINSEGSHYSLHWGAQKIVAPEIGTTNGVIHKIDTLNVPAQYWQLGK